MMHVAQLCLCNILRQEKQNVSIAFVICRNKKGLSIVLLFKTSRIDIFIPEWMLSIQ